MVTRAGHLDKVEVLVEARPELSERLTAAESEATGRALEHAIKTYVGISTQVRVLAAGGVERTSTGKARRVIDKRPKGEPVQAQGAS